jgi:hypothetical protein
VDLSNGHTLDADLVFNDKDYFASLTDPLTPAPPATAPAPQQTSVDLQAVLTHEFGHFFGLDHTSIAGATMVPFIASNTSQRSLELDDTAGLSAIFPTPEFLSSTGAITGKVLSGLTGLATFGAHVEAIPRFAGSNVSGISGELTLRDGQGEFRIGGLPPGEYDVRIVPLDGVQTVAADANIGGVFAGIDTDFEIEYWNGAGESGIGFDDPPTSAPTPVSVPAGGTASDIVFLTNTYPGRIFVEPYGQFESTVTGANNASLAVRFDLPFAVPYTIKSANFPTFTFNGQPGEFISLSLCRMNPATGTPDLAAPIKTFSNYAVSAGGPNSVPLDVTITTPNETLFWVMRFPSTASPKFPYIRIDYTNHDRGFFAATYTINAAGAVAIQNIYQVAAGLTVLTNPDLAPMKAPVGTGANRLIDRAEFSYIPPANVRADGFPLPNNFLGSANLLKRATAVYSTVAVGGAGNGVIKLEPNPTVSAWEIWSVQAVDKAGHGSVLSNVTYTGNVAGAVEDADEPNGRTNESTILTLPVVNRAETIWPAGDQDYFTFSANVGQVITATATATLQNGTNDLDTVMILFDGAGKIVATNDDAAAGTLSSKITYTVPPPSPSSGKTQQKFTLFVADFNGSVFSPATAARVIFPPGYALSVSTAAPTPAP